MRVDQLTEALSKQKNDPGIQALKKFLATNEIKLRKPENTITFAEFADYLVKNNQMELLISIQEEKGDAFFRYFKEVDKKANKKTLDKTPKKQFKKNNRK